MQGVADTTCSTETVSSSDAAASPDVRSDILRHLPDMRQRWEEACEEALANDEQHPPVLMLSLVTKGLDVHGNERLSRTEATYEMLRANGYNVVDLPLFPSKLAPHNSSGRCDKKPNAKLRKITADELNKIFHDLQGLVEEKRVFACGLVAKSVVVGMNILSITGISEFYHHAEDVFEHLQGSPGLPEEQRFWHVVGPTVRWEQKPELERQAFRDAMSHIARLVSESRDLPSRKLILTNFWAKGSEMDRFGNARVMWRGRAPDEKKRILAQVHNGYKLKMTPERQAETRRKRAATWALNPQKRAKHLICCFCA